MGSDSNDSATEGGSGPLRSLPPAVRWLAGSAGLTGILALIGYVSQSAYYNFLGVTVPEFTVTSCITEAGGMLVDLVTILFLWINAHVLGAIMVLIGAAIILSARQMKWASRIPSLPTAAVVILFVFVSLAKIVAFDLPVVAMNDLLHKDVAAFDSVYPDAGRVRAARKGESAFIGFLRAYLSPALLVEWRARQTWLDVVCMRAPEAPTLQNATAKTCPPIDSEGGRLTRQEAYRQHTEETFLANCVLMVVLLALAFAFFTRAPKTGERYVILRWLVLVLLGINLFALPSVYAKTIRDTTFRDAELIIQTPATKAAPQTAGVELAMVEADAKASAKAGGRMPSKSAARQSPQGADHPNAGCDTTRSVVDCNFFILGESSDEWTLLERTSLQVWYVPRSEIAAARVNELSDVLQYYIRNKPVPPSAPPPGPPPGP